ncbi:MAG: alanine--tRNA ligase [Candidatus Nomurabacteria bacterium]|nr:alanine--tRNA ligase [Candidatus Nomurabacteria bacterium]USN87932.1 MAG: alanine--tRNA ligase [Candidatus Nomurabacteria bacterium]
MGGNEIRQKYLEFMEKNGHAVIPSAALVPENDPTTLFTGSGMQPLIPYLQGEAHPKGVRLTDSQKCFRANDIEEVGDNRHTTFFEMLGNWSLGDYFKKEQLRWFFTYLVDEVGLDPERIYVTVFAGDESLGIPADEESVAIWQELFKEKGIEAKDVHIGSEEAGYQLGMQGGRIFYYDAGKNWWSRSGTPDKMPTGEIGGPDSEVFYDFGPEYATHPDYKDKEPHPNSDSGQFVEIGNSVFMEYVKQEDGSFAKLPQRNVDFGGGLERIAAAKNNDPDMFKVDLLWNVVTEIENLSGKKYEDNLTAFRVITDHIRGAVFLIADGVLPGNTDQGYFVRRLLRRSVMFADQLSAPEGMLPGLAGKVIETYGDHYPNLKLKELDIRSTIGKEEEQFRSTLESGLKQFNKISLQVHVTSKEVGGKKIIDKSVPPVAKKAISAQNAFDLYTTYGFPIELTEEIAAEKGLVVDRAGFEKLMEEHRAKSRAGAEQKFKGGLADHSEKVVYYHTATHLLLAGLRKYLGDHVHQAGSNITGERLRFDFTHPDKVDRETLDKVEEYVNHAIKLGGQVTIEMMAKDKAQSDDTIEASFWDRYPDEVKVYTMTGGDGTVFSRELCGGPHVGNLSEIQGEFKIKKEESSAAGIRRIKAVLV